MKKKTKNKIKYYFFIYSMLAIALLHFVVFYLGVNFNSILLAFQDKDTGAFTFDNFAHFFRDLTTPDSGFEYYFKNTFKYYLTNIFITLPLSYVLSFFLYKKIFMGKAFRVIYVLPMIISSVVFFGVYKELLSNNGILQQLYSAITGKSAPSFIYDPAYTTTTLLVYGVWTGMGLNLIMFTGGLFRIPEEVFESAQIDGAGMFREMISIAFPLTWPTFSTLLLTSAVGIFSASGPILLVSQDPDRKIWTLSYWLYNEVIKASDGNYNYAAAYGIILTLLTMPIFMIVQKIRKKIPDSEY